MTSETKRWERNTQGLFTSAQQKAAQTQQRAENAIALLLKEQCPINFKTVAQTASISTAWLYAHEEIKLRIIHLRNQQLPKTTVHIPPKEQASNASKDAMIAALQKRVQVLTKENRELRTQLEAAYMPLYKQETTPSMRSETKKK